MFVIGAEPGLVWQGWEHSDSDTRVTRPWLWQVTKVTAGASVISMSDRHDVSVNQKTWTPRHRQPSVCGYSLNNLSLHYCRGCHTSVIVRALLELQSSNIFWRIEGWKCVKYLVHIKYFKLGNENISIFDDLTNSHSDQNPKNWTLIQQTFLNLVYWASVTWIVTFYSQILTLDFQTSSRLPGFWPRGIPK